MNEDEEDNVYGTAHLSELSGDLSLQTRKEES